jgi:hypothetical protein
VRKIIREILALVWKVLRLVLWRWLKPRIGKIFMAAAVFIGLIVLAVFVLARL